MTIPKIRKMEAAKRQSENVTPTTRQNIERGELSRMSPQGKVVIEGNFQRKVREILSNPTTSTRNRFNVNRTTSKVSRLKALIKNYYRKRSLSSKILSTTI